MLQLPIKESTLLGTRTATARSTPSPRAASSSPALSDLSPPRETSPGPDIDALQSRFGSVNECQGHTCDCGANFRTAQDYGTHKYICSAPQAFQYVCAKCGERKELGDEEGMKKHVWDAHGKEIRREMKKEGGRSWRRMERDMGLREVVDCETIRVGGEVTITHGRVERKKRGREKK